MFKIYESDEKIFEHNGLRTLKPTKAIIYKEDNSDYYLELEGSIKDIDIVKFGNIIRVPSPWGEQGFRLQHPEKKNNKIYVKAKHLYYDTENYLIEDSYVVDKGCNDALDHLNSASETVTPFSTSSNIIKTNSFRCVRKTLNEAINVVLDRWGGHLIRDNFNIKINSSIGKDNGVTLRYQKNIQEITEKTDSTNLVTKLLPVRKRWIATTRKICLLLI